MIDVETVDKLYETGRQVGVQMVWKLFDKTFLMPLAMLPDAVTNETGEAITEDALRAKAAAGWFPLLKRASLDGNEEGAPVYVPSRVGLFLKLERDGYGADELRLIAEHEEWAIDNAFTTDDLAYVDDDLDTLLLHAQARLDAFGGRTPPAEELEIEEARRRVRFLATLKDKGIPDKLRETIEKHAFRVRAFNDAMRVWLLDMDRAKIRAGYSPNVHFSSHRWSADDGFQAGQLLWEETIRGALAYGESGEVPAIRLPGFVLRGDRVAPTRTLRPGDYSALWKQHELDEYLTTWSRLRGQRCCLNCFVPLEAANERKRFCGDRCRNAAKQRRFRERNPDAVERAQKRYWDSIDMEEP